LSESNGRKWHQIEWTTVGIVIITWLMSAGITYGVLSTKIGNLEQNQTQINTRIDVIEKRQIDVIQHYLTREEYETLHNQLENKVEQNRTELGGKIDGIRDLMIRTHTKELKAVN